MIFALFALAIAAVFFASSLILLNSGRHLGLRYLHQQKDAANMAGLATVEGAVFALIGLLLAFTISGALQRALPETIEQFGKDRVGRLTFSRHRANARAAAPGTSGTSQTAPARILDSPMKGFSCGLGRNK